MCDNTLDKKFGQLSPNKGCLNPPPHFRVQTLSLPQWTWSRLTILTALFQVKNFQKHSSEPPLPFQKN